MNIVILLASGGSGRVVRMSGQACLTTYNNVS